MESLSILAALPTVEPVVVEAPLGKGVDQTAEAEALVSRLAVLPSGIRAWVELQRAPQWRSALPLLAAAGEDVGVKLRTGGTVAQAYPSNGELGSFLRAAVDVEVAFKLTADLHTAPRGPAAATGADRHGVLNVIGALRAALNGAETHDIETVPRGAVARQVGVRGPADERGRRRSRPCVLRFVRLLRCHRPRRRPGRPGTSRGRML
jgi:hypothetical protein